MANEFANGSILSNLHKLPRQRTSHYNTHQSSIINHHSILFVPAIIFSVQQMLPPFAQLPTLRLSTSCKCRLLFSTKLSNSKKSKHFFFLFLRAYLPSLAHNCVSREYKSLPRAEVSSVNSKRPPTSNPTSASQTPRELPVGLQV